MELQFSVSVLFGETYDEVIDYFGVYRGTALLDMFIFRFLRGIGHPNSLSHPSLLRFVLGAVGNERLV